MKTEDERGWSCNGTSVSFRQINFSENFHCTFEICAESLPVPKVNQSNLVHLIGVMTWVHKALISCVTLSKSHHLSEPQFCIFKLGMLVYKWNHIVSDLIILAFLPW